MRYSHLASSFASLDMTEEACLTLVLAIVYDVIATVQIEDESKPIHLLRKLSTMTNGVVLMGTSLEFSGSRHSFVSRLVRLSETLSSKSWSLPQWSTGEDFILCARRSLRTSAGFPSEESNNDSEIGKDASNRFGIATLLSSAFKDSKLLHIVKKTHTDIVRNEQLLTVADVVIEHGAILQREVSFDQSNSISANVQMKDFNKSFQFLEWLAKNTFQDDEAMTNISVALVYILAATSLVPATATGWSEVSKQQTPSSNQNEIDVMLSKARKLLSRTTETLSGTLDRIRKEEHIGKGEQRLLASALLTCAALYSSEISGADPAVVAPTTKHVIVSSGQEAVQLLIETESIGDEMKEACRMCLTRTLTRFQDMVNIEGDKLTAAQAALIIARIHDGSGNEDERWYWAMAGNLLQDGGLNRIAKDVLGQKHLRQEMIIMGNEFHSKDLLQLEMVATRLRMDMQSFDADTFKQAARDAQGLFDQCNMILAQPATEPLTRIVLRWVCSSCVMALAEGIQCRGAPNRAVHFLRQGVNLCQESISALRKLRNVSALVYYGDCSTAWEDIALSSFHLRLTERRIAGQQQISTAYALLGDHRRSEAYAVGVATECMLGNFDMKKQRLKIKELASIDRNGIHVLRQSASYRLLLEMKAKASPSDRILASLHQVMAFDGILAATNVGHTIEEFAWQIDGIWNLVIGKFITTRILVSQRCYAVLCCRISQFRPSQPNSWRSTLSFNGHS